MLGVLLAVFISGPKPVTRPPTAALKSVPEVVRKGETSEDARPIDRLMHGWPLAQAGPLVIKTDFKHGLAARLWLKF